MENKEQYMKCSYYNCDESFMPEYFSTGFFLPPIKDENKYQQLMEGIIKTRMFCMECVVKITQQLNFFIQK
jgi:hypothetical protein